MSSAAEASRTTYVLVDGENIDATLGGSILQRRPAPEERPRWDRLLEFAQQRFGNPVVGLFFLACHGELPMPFVQALMSIGYRPIPLTGPADVKIVDVAVQRTLEVLAARDDDVMLVSNDGDFVPPIESLLGDRRVAVIGFSEYRNARFSDLVGRGLETFDLERDVKAFNFRLPRVRVIPIDEFDPAEFL